MYTNDTQVRTSTVTHTHNFVLVQALKIGLLIECSHSSMNFVLVRNCLLLASSYNDDLYDILLHEPLLRIAVLCQARDSRCLHKSLL